MQESRRARRSHVPTIKTCWSGPSGVGRNSSMISRARARAHCAEAYGPAPGPWAPMSRYSTAIPRRCAASTRYWAIAYARCSPTRDVVELLCPRADLVIASVLVPGSTTPKLITAQTVKAVKTGAMSQAHGMKYRGRKPTFSRDQFTLVRELLDQGDRCLGNCENNGLKAAIDLSHPSRTRTAGLRGFIGMVSERSCQTNSEDFPEPDAPITTSKQAPPWATATDTPVRKTKGQPDSPLSLALS